MASRRRGWARPLADAQSACGVGPLVAPARSPYDHVMRPPNAPDGADRQGCGGGTALGREAVLSVGGTHRYRLDRTWGIGPVIGFVMLNPSTADARVDDPTIRRCMGFGRSLGGGGVTIVNLSSYRSPHPADIPTRRPPRAYREANLQAIADACALVAATGGRLIAGWGARVDDRRLAYLHQSIDTFVRVAVDHAIVVECLGTTRSGQPRHPLYVRATTAVRPWRAPPA